MSYTVTVYKITFKSSLGDISELVLVTDADTKLPNREWLIEQAKGQLVTSVEKFYRSFIGSLEPTGEITHKDFEF